MCKLVKIIKDAGNKIDYYSISFKIRQILLHWGYELTEKTPFFKLFDKLMSKNFAYLAYIQRIFVYLAVLAQSSLCLKI